MLKLEEILKPAIDKPQRPPKKNPAAARPQTRKPAATTRNGIRTPKDPTANDKTDAATTRTPAVAAEIAAAAEHDARQAHSGQTDTTGRPCEEHLGRVAGAFSDPGDVAVAWLHDTIGNTSLTASELVRRGFPQFLVDDIETLTHQGVEKYGGYIERIGAEGTARTIAIKVADIRDRLETNPNALANDDRRRYRHALKRLRHHARRRNLATTSQAATSTGRRDPPDRPERQTGEREMNDNQTRAAAARRPKLLPIGRGRMGRMVMALAADAGFDIAEPMHSENNAGGAGLTAELLKDIAVAVDFSTAEALESNLPILSTAGVNVVIGTTGWHGSRERLRLQCLAAPIGVVAASNFSVGVQYFMALARHAGVLLADETDMGAYVHEQHHARKTDKPSGTALEIVAGMIKAGYGRQIDMSSTRAGHAPGIHTVGFDSPTETITLKHQTRDRRTFVNGALLAARWVLDRRGWFGMTDVLGLDVDPLTAGRRP